MEAAQEAAPSTVRQAVEADHRTRKGIEQSLNQLAQELRRRSIRVTSSADARSLIEARFEGTELENHLAIEMVPLNETLTGIILGGFTVNVERDLKHGQRFVIKIGLTPAHR